MRPPITYYGGKQRLSGELLKLMPEHKLYVEPFMGGGALFFAKEPSEAEIINDLNGNVTNFYYVVQNQFDELKKLIDGTLHSRATYQKALKIYYEYIPNEIGDPLCGWAFWAVTNQGFGGKIGSWALGRDGKIGKTLANKRKGFTKEYAERLKAVQIESKDALEIIKQYDSPDTFFYLDPPYFNSDCGHYKGYTESDYVRLLDMLTVLKGKFLLSSYPSTILSEYVEKQGWSYREKHQKVSVSSKHRKEKTEVMAYNYPVQEQAVKAPYYKKPSLTVAVQNKNEKSKREEAEKVDIEEKYSGDSPLHLIEKVRCFASPYKKGAKMKRKRIAQVEPLIEEKESKAALTPIHEGKLEYKGKHNTYYVLGEVPMDLSTLKVTLLISEEDSIKKERCKLDLYEREEVQQGVAVIAKTFLLEEEMVMADIMILTDLLERHRESLTEVQQRKVYQKAVHQSGTSTAVIEYLSQPQLMKHTDKLIEKAGVIGQERIRMLMFLVAASYKNTSPIHLGIKGRNAESLIEMLSECIPIEDRVILNNVSGKSLYHCTNGELMNKALLLPCGLEKKAAGALGQLQQQGTLSTATTVKDKLGNMVTALKQVKSHFSTVMLKNNEGEDNSLLMVTADESKEQLIKSVQYHNAKFAGSHDEKAESNAREFLQNVLRSIKPLEVINPYAGKVIIPISGQAMLRMNHIYQSLIKQVSLFHQYQRKRDKEGRVIAELKDMQIAGDILFNAMTIEDDELEPDLRRFYDEVKGYILKKEGKKASGYWFTMRELRNELDISRSSCFRYISELHRLDYIERTGYANKGLKYRVVYWDDMEKSRKQILKKVNEQLQSISIPKNVPLFGTPEPPSSKRLTRSIPCAV